MKTLRTLLVQSTLALALFIVQTQVGNSQSIDSRRLISYQGVIASSEVQPSGSADLIVTMYSDPNGTIKVWEGSYSTKLSNGLFNIMLGSGEYPLPPPEQLDRAL